jgi:hypothetical protein
MDPLEVAALVCLQDTWRKLLLRLDKAPPAHLFKMHTLIIAFIVMYRYIR